MGQVDFAAFSAARPLVHENVRPTRTNRGLRIHQMEKTSEVIGHDLDRLNRKRAGTAIDESQDTMPGMPENPMAPPATKRRKPRQAEKDSTMHAVHIDPPLQLAPKPVKSLPPSGFYPQVQDLSHDVLDSGRHQKAPKPPVTRTYSRHGATDALPNSSNHTESSNGDLARKAPPTYSVFTVQPQGPDHRQPALSRWTHHAPMQQDDAADDSCQDSALPKAPKLFLPDDMQVHQSPAKGPRRRKDRPDEDMQYEPDSEEGDEESGHEEELEQVDNFYQVKDYQGPNHMNTTLEVNIAQSTFQDQNPFQEECYPGGFYDTTEHAQDADMAGPRPEGISFTVLHHYLLLFSLFCSPLDIDENSPSEDEQNALSIIQAGHVEAQNRPVDLDVLQEHRKRNHPNRPPRPERLEVAAVHQQRVQNIPQEYAAQDDREESSDEEEEGPEDVQSVRAPRNSRFHGEVKPTTLGFYHGSFQVAIELAKKEFRGYVMLHNGFPERSKHLHEAGHVLTRILSECEKKGYIFEEDDIQTRNTNIVFKEASTYRGKMKTLARQLVLHFYQKDLNPPDLVEGNQLQQQEVVAANVAELLGDETPYLMNGKDEQGKTNNIAHPCIRELCIQQFYGNGQDSIANTFPDHFKDAVPEHAIAIVMACIYNALQEYELGYFCKEPFKGSRYKEIYETSLDLINEVKASPYHKAKWDANRRHWARDGMKLLNPAVERRRTKMKVHID